MNLFFAKIKLFDKWVLTTKAKIRIRFPNDDNLKLVINGNGPFSNLSFVDSNNINLYLKDRRKMAQALVGNKDAYISSLTINEYFVRNKNASLKEQRLKTEIYKAYLEATDFVYYDFYLVLQGFVHGTLENPKKQITKNTLTKHIRTYPGYSSQTLYESGHLIDLISQNDGIKYKGYENIDISLTDLLHYYPLGGRDSIDSKEILDFFKMITVGDEI